MVIIKRRLVMGEREPVKVMTMTSAYQVSVPKEMRLAFGLKPGCLLGFEQTDRGMLVYPVEVKVRRTE